MMQTTVKILLILIVGTFVVTNAGCVKNALATTEPITKAFCELHKLLPEKEKTGISFMPSSKQLEEICNKLLHVYPAETGPQDQGKAK